MSKKLCNAVFGFFLTFYSTVRLTENDIYSESRRAPRDRTRIQPGPVPELAPEPAFDQQSTFATLYMAS